MPFDGQTYKQPVTKEFTVQEVIDWAKTKKPSTTYKYACISNCIIAQFLKETGRAKHPSVGAPYWRLDGETYPFPGQTYQEQVAFNTCVASTPHTFGAAVKRLEAYAKAS